jgi:hypothetical protein
MQAEGRDAEQAKEDHGVGSGDPLPLDNQARPRGLVA